jgi:tetratricopeptide (TPR) repeat protein
VSKEEETAMAKQLIAEMRQAFAQGDWNETTQFYERISGLKTDRALRLEATCLAARSLAAIKQRSTARQLLKRVDKADYKKATHYEFLARAHLDLKQYRSAAEACERAEELRAAEVK